jgi:uncharacterized protein
LTSLCFSVTLILDIHQPGWGDGVYIDDFIWLEGIVDKLAVKHGVTPEEVEEVFFNRPRYRFVEKGRRTDEDVYLAVGQTESGRYLIVFFIQKPANRALILSARDMDGSERKRHERR